MVNKEARRLVFTPKATRYFENKGYPEAERNSIKEACKKLLNNPTPRDSRRHFKYRTIDVMENTIIYKYVAVSQEIRIIEIRNIKRLL